MKTTITAYKVVRQEGMKSVLSPSLPSSYIVTYKVGEFVSGINGSSLFVFDTLLNAKDFISGASTRYYIYECEAQEVYKPKTMARPSNWSFIENFWKARNKKKSPDYSTEPPSGTLWAKRVKLLNLVFASPK